MVRTRSPHRVLPIIRQSWRDVSFVHWAFDPAVVQRALPPRLIVDTHAEQAWVSIVCFSTTCSLARAVPLPGPRRYPETNVRTYVRGPDGRDGLYFFSLDVTNRANVVLGRGTGLRYRLADMEMDIGEEWRYRGRRRRDAAASYDVAIEPCAGQAASDLDQFLTARWSAYVDLRSHLIRYDVQHPSWPLRPAVLRSCTQTLLAADGLPAPSSEPLAHVSEGVDVNLAPHRLMR